jgi:hypothetical protein
VTDWGAGRTDRRLEGPSARELGLQRNDSANRYLGDKALREYLSERALLRAQQLTPAAFADQVAVGYRRLGLID